MWKRHLRLTLAVLVIAVQAGCQGDIQPEPELVRPVRYARVVPQGAMEARTYSGSTKAELETDLSFKVGGNLILRDADVGDAISVGQLVAQLDPTDYQVRAQEAEAGLARARAELRNAQANYERTRDLYENRNASRSDLDAARAGSESAGAQVRAATQRLEAARLQLSYTRLSAPAVCTVAQTFVELNQNVAAGQSILRVNCGQCAEVVVSVPELDISRINAGTTVAVAVDAIPGEVLTGVITEVGVATGRGGATYPVTVALQEGCKSVRSGMAADVTFRFPTAGPSGVLVVPFVAVGEDVNGRFVFVLEPSDGESGEQWFARRRAVTVGGPTADGLAITSGLADGEIIATAGVRRLTDGQQVTLFGDT
jgi:RND family efflux transporter MFP subunit